MSCPHRPLICSIRCYAYNCAIASIGILLSGSNAGGSLVRVCRRSLQVLSVRNICCFCRMLHVSASSCVVRWSCAHCTNRLTDWTLSTAVEEHCRAVYWRVSLGVGVRTWTARGAGLDKCKSSRARIRRQRRRRRSHRGPYSIDGFSCLPELLSVFRCCCIVVVARLPEYYVFHVFYVLCRDPSKQDSSHERQCWLRSSFCSAARREFAFHNVVGKPGAAHRPPDCRS